MTDNFYDRVARRFDGYRSKDPYTPESVVEEPEDAFEGYIRKLAAPDKSVLDMGCGDARFTLPLAEAFGTVTGVDTSEGMLEVAWRLQRERGLNNVTLLKQDAEHTTFPDGSFDVVYSRRGPAFFDECYRLLSPGGYFLLIGIGNRDAVELKEVFGRGQMFETRNVSVLEKTRRGLEQAGLRVLLQSDYYYDDYYASYPELELFLQAVPIFEDFDPEDNRALLEKFVQQYSTDDGILLRRHRVLNVASKG